ncbi:MAG: filamentous hemagglutinin N-terminal domain-containing protein [Rubrivivax sp.]|nr:filamentous hemagglutinin N-terminal domain-containing protein [Rubrivivax sp.]
MTTRHRSRLARRTTLRLTQLATALAAGGLLSAPAAAAPEGGTVRAGSATITQTGAPNATQTRIDQSSQRAVIDWRSFSVGAAEQVQFAQPSATSATLNRVTGEQLSAIHGRISANGQVFLVNPNGVVLGRGAQVNVGSFVASTAGIGNADFMAGRLEFRQPGAAGASIANRGHITAAEGGLVALVAPHVRNDGVIQARLGRVALGAGDTFALDLHGDGLIRLAVDAAQARLLVDAEGRPVTTLIQHTGRIEADGGQVVLMSAANAKAALDQVINLSGTVRADTVQQHGGRIVLAASGGATTVSGQLSAQGQGAGEAGGRIEVLGESVHLASSAQLDASGHAGGGTVHVGGAWQGSGTTPRAATTTVDGGTRIAADARHQGRGGEVVVWADGATTYAGHISARGGAAGGDGGRVEVSGKRTLEFAGTVDAGAAQGAAGSLLLDPATMDIGLAEASLINRVLRTGTSTTVSADVDINLNATIDGRGRIAGGGLTLNAGRDIHLNEYLVTANGAVTLNAATGTVRLAAGRGVFTGSAPITVRSGADLAAGPYVTSGALSLTSTAGSVSLDAPLDATLGAVTVNAAQDVRINQPVVHLRNGSTFTVTAGRDIFVDAQVDGRGGVARSGAVNLTAGGNVRLGESVVTQLADIRMRAIAGTISTAAGRGVFAFGPAASVPGGVIVDLSAGADFTTGIVSNSGFVNLASLNGSLTLGQGIDASAGITSLLAGLDIFIDTPVLNLRSGAGFGALAGRDIHVRAPIDARAASGGVAGAGVTLNAERSIFVNDSVVTRDGLIALTTNTGTVTQAATAQLRAGNGAIGVTAAGNLVTGSYVTTGALTLRSTAGAISVAEPIYDSVGATTLTAATDVVVQPGNRIENVRTGAPLAINAGRDILVNEQIGQDRDATTLTGPITMTAGRHVAINADVVTRDAPLAVTATTGTVTMAPQVAGVPQLRAGSGTLSVTAGADLYFGSPTAPRPNNETPFITSGTLNVSSTGGTLFIEAPVPSTTGRVNLNGGNALRVNERIYSNNADITLTAGLGGIVMNAGTIDVGGFTTTLSDTDARLGNLTLTARGDINAPSVRTAATLAITSTEGRITSGTVLVSRNGPVPEPPLGMPQRVLLAGALGIDSFNTASSPDVEARSSQGSVNLTVFAPQRLFIEAAQDVRTGGFIGQQVELVGGRDVLLEGVALAGLLRVRAGQDFRMDDSTSLAALRAQAGRDVRLTDAPGSLTWIAGAGGNLTLRDSASPGAVVSVRGLHLSAGRDVLLPQPTHVSDSLLTGTEATLQPTTLVAGRHVYVDRLQTIGDVAMTATAGNVTVAFPLIPPSGVLAPAPHVWNPADVGVSSLAISAPGTGAVISLQGVRAVGNVSLVAPAGTVNSAFAVTSSGGAVSIVAPVQNISVTPIPPSARLSPPAVVSPAVAPGPLRADAPGPLIPAAPAPGAPGLSEILVAAPGAIDAGALPAPGAAGGEGDSAAQQAASAARTGSGAAAGGEAEAADAAEASGADAAARMAAGLPVVIFSGGRGSAQGADLGRSGTYGSARAPQVRTEGDSEQERRRRGATPGKAATGAATGAGTGAATGAGTGAATQPPAPAGTPTPR